MSELEPAAPPADAPRWTLGDVVLAATLGTFMGIVAAGMAAVLLLRDASSSVTFLVVGTLVYGAVAGMIGLLVVQRRGVPLVDLGFRNVGIKPVLLMIPMTLVVLIMNFVVAAITAMIFGEVPTAEDQLAIRETISVVDFACLLVVGAVIAPIVEELVFRGLLYRAIRSRWGIAWASIVTALLFSVVHFTPLLIGVFFVFGLILAAVVEHYKSLYPPIVLHALNNSVALVLLYVSQ